MTPATPSSPGPTSRWIVPLLAIGLALAMALLSRGFLEPDEITHYVYARAVWHDWRAVTNIWGRFGATSLFALAAPLGPMGSRLLAVAITALTGWGTCRLLRQFLAPGETSFFRRHAEAFVWLLLFAQPCFLLNSFTVMTEMLLACAWVWALTALAARRVVVAGLLIGIGGLMRPEGWIAIAAWPVALALVASLLFRPGPSRGAFATSVLLALLPVSVWYFLGAWGAHDWGWFVAAWPWSPASQYGRSGAVFVLASLATLAGWMWVPVALGAWSMRRPGDSRRGLVLLVWPAAGFFLLHGTLGTLGLFGSMSLPRYFVAVAPLLAILALLGLLEIERRAGKWLPPVVMILGLMPLITLSCFGYLPMQPTVEQQRLEVIARALRTADPATIIAGHPYVWLQLGMDPGFPSQEAIAQAPPGTCLVADSTVWYYENRPDAAQLAAWGFREDRATADAVDAIPDRLEPLTIKAAGALDGHVRLWIKP